MNLQANSTREFSEHATESQSSMGGGLKGECAEGVHTGFGSGDFKTDKQTIVDHMTMMYAGDPNDLRSRIVQRGRTDETDAVHPRLCNADKGEDQVKKEAGFPLQVY